MRVCALHAAGRIDTDNFNDLTICFVGLAFNSKRYHVIRFVSLIFSRLVVERFVRAMHAAAACASKIHDLLATFYA